MSNESARSYTPSKKNKRDEKRSGLEELLKKIPLDILGRNFQELAFDLEEALILIQNQKEAKRILECDFSKIEKFDFDEDVKQQLCCLIGEIKERAGVYEEALEEFLKIAAQNDRALEGVLRLCKNSFSKIKGNNKIEGFLKNIGIFLAKKEKSSQPEIILLRAANAASKLHDVQVRMASDGSHQKPKWPSVLKDSLLELRKVPKLFVQIFEFQLKGTDKNSKSPLESERFFEIVFSIFEDEVSKSDIEIIAGFLEAYKKTELCKEGKLKDKVQILEDKMNRNNEFDEAPEETSHFFSEVRDQEPTQGFLNEKSVQLDKDTVARLEAEALESNEASMQQLLAYSEDKNFSARPEALESVGRVYLAVGKFKSNGKGVFEYYGKKGPNQSFAGARDVFESFYKGGSRVGIYYDIALRYREGKLFKKNMFLARRILEEGMACGDLNPEGLILLASLYFWGEGGIERFPKAQEILIKLNNENLLDKYPDALYILAECHYLFYLDAKLNEQDSAAQPLYAKAHELFKAAATQGHADATSCLALFSEAPEPMDLNEEERRDNGDASVHVDEPSEQALPEAPFKVEILLTQLCDALRACNCNMLDATVVALKTELCALDPSYADCTSKNLFTKLKHLEKNHGRYFDDIPSEDSDSGKDQEYHANDKAFSADKYDANKVIGKLRKYTQHCLNVLEQTDEGKLEEKYKSYASEFKSKYVAELKTMEVNKKPTMEARRDLETVMHYAGQGRLAEALAQINTPFYVAQTRGIHFFRNKWTREERHQFKVDIFAGHHPLLKKPIYSASVYALAQVRERFPEDRLSQLKLQQAARCVSYRLRQLRDLSPHPHEELPSALRTDSIKERKYTNRLMQVQQLYSAKYDAFIEDYLTWELKLSPHYFINPQMHFVSTADLQSKHSSEYALGNKVYGSSKRYRERPRYGEQLRATRTQMGAVFLTLHPLEDYLPERNNHIPSLNVQGEVELSNEIVSERESTFFGGIPAGRLAHIEHMRFPSFHHAEYLEAMRLRYGLDKELYDRFKKLLSTSKPHEPKNRLTILLLGEHIAAFKTLYLQRRADRLMKTLGDPESVKKQDEKLKIDPRMKEKESAKTERPYLLFRTPTGNFSFFPDQPYAASENGDDPYLRSRRLQTAYHKKLARDGKLKSASGQSQAQSTQVSSQLQPERVRTLGDGNCAFNAVTLGVCELLEQHLLPKNDLFDLEFIQKLDLKNESREDLIVAISNIRDSEVRQRKFQLIIRQIAVHHIEENYHAIYGDSYRALLHQAFENFVREDNDEDDIFCVHDFIKAKFTEEKLSPEALEVWWEHEGGREQYFNALRESARNTFDHARWGSEAEIDAFGKFLGIKILWQSRRMIEPKTIGANVEDETIPPAFGVYFSDRHWNYVRLPHPLPQLPTISAEQEQQEVEDDVQLESHEEFQGQEDQGESETRHAEEFEDKRKTSLSATLRNV